jgi:hypothetical protein
VVDPARPRLGAIRAVTYAVPDLKAVEAAYVGTLGYQVAFRGVVGAAQALAWDAPAVEGRALLGLGPASGEAVHLRFVESPQAAGWQALKTWGWNATEFVVQDVDALARRLDSGPFHIIGPPKPLTRFPMIRAMQTIGPAGECCYFTEVGPGSGLDLAPALSFVGRVFIVVGAGPEADALFAPYTAFANRLDPPVATPVQVISAAHGLPTDTLHRHGLVRLTAGTLVELDAYPPSAGPRLTFEGELPPGMVVVSFEVDHLDGHDFVAPAVPCELPGGGLAGCLRGAVGELIELIAPESISRETHP